MGFGTICLDFLLEWVDWLHRLIRRKSCRTPVAAAVCSSVQAARLAALPYSTEGHDTVVGGGHQIDNAPSVVPSLRQQEVVARVKRSRSLLHYPPAMAAFNRQRRRLLRAKDRSSLSVEEVTGQPQPLSVGASSTTKKRYNRLYGRIIGIHFKIPPKPPSYAFVEVFSAFGTVQKIAMSEKNGGMQALIQYPEDAFFADQGFSEVPIDGSTIGQPVVFQSFPADFRGNDWLK
ncbi:hypothetical protein ABZP36_032900 [Zizania latifolia]